MKPQRKILCIFFLFGFYVVYMQGRESVSAKVGTTNIKEVSVGSIIDRIISGANPGIYSAIFQGNQESNNISVVTTRDNTEGIIPDYKVYPDLPVRVIFLMIRFLNRGDSLFRLCYLNLILNQNIN